MSDNFDPVWKALSDPTRRGLLDLLKESPRTTGYLCQQFPNLSRFAVMKHLSVLEEAHLVFVRASGRERWNHLNAVPIQQIHDRWIRPYEAHWASSLLRLKQFAETGPRPDEKGMSPMPQATASATNDKVSQVGFMAVDQEIRIDAPPARVFKALTKDTAAWWDAERSISEEIVDIVLELELGGRFYEVGKNGETHLWSRVTGLAPDAYIEFTGPMGAPGAVHGVYSFTLEKQGEGTLLQLSHHAIGEVNERMQEDYSGGWKALTGQLKRFVEKGERLGIRK